VWGGGHWSLAHSQHGFNEGCGFASHACGATQGFRMSFIMPGNLRCPPSRKKFKCNPSCVSFEHGPVQKILDKRY
jgi:hypothetical protein